MNFLRSLFLFTIIILVNMQCSPLVDLENIQTGLLAAGLQSGDVYWREPQIKLKYMFILKRRQSQSPQVSIGLTAFDSVRATTNFSFNIIAAQSTATSILVRLTVPWTLTEWNSLKFSLIVNSRSDFQVGMFSVPNWQRNQVQVTIPFARSNLYGSNNIARPFISGINIQANSSTLSLQVLQLSVDTNSMIVGVASNSLILNMSLGYLVYSPPQAGFTSYGGIASQPQVRGILYQVIQASLSTLSNYALGVTGFSLGTALPFTFSTSIDSNFILSLVGDVKNLTVSFIIFGISPNRTCSNCPNTMPNYNRCVQICTPTQAFYTFNDSSRGCIECPDYAYLTLNANKSDCICKQGYYIVRGICMPLPPSTQYINNQLVNTGVTTTTYTTTTTTGSNSSNSILNSGFNAGSGYISGSTSGSGSGLSSGSASNSNSSATSLSSLNALNSISAQALQSQFFGALGGRNTTTTQTTTYITGGTGGVVPSQSQQVYVSQPVGVQSGIGSTNATNIALTGIYNTNQGPIQTNTISIPISSLTQQGAQFVLNATIPLSNLNTNDGITNVTTTRTTTTYNQNQNINQQNQQNIIQNANTQNTIQSSTQGRCSDSNSYYVASLNTCYCNPGFYNLNGGCQSCPNGTYYNGANCINSTTQQIYNPLSATIQGQLQNVAQGQGFVQNQGLNQNPVVNQQYLLNQQNQQGSLNNQNQNFNSGASASSVGGSSAILGTNYLPLSYIPNPQQNVPATQQGGYQGGQGIQGAQIINGTQGLNPSQIQRVIQTLQNAQGQGTQGLQSTQNNQNIQGIQGNLQGNLQGQAIQGYQGQSIQGVPGIPVGTGKTASGLPLQYIPYRSN